jgi:hypothetical protein
MNRYCSTVVAAILIAGAAFATTPSPTYHLLHRFTLGGEGFWDYLSLDAAGHRLFIARQDRIMVVDPDSGKLLAEIPGLQRAHGVAFDERTGRGFATSGSDAMVTVFDLKSLAVLGKTPVDADDDAIAFDPASGHVFTFNGDAHSASVLDGATGKRLATVPLGAKPEFGVSAGDGKLYVNLESSSQVAEIDSRTNQVTRTWALAPCESPTGMAIDTAHHRLFSGCRNSLLAVSDTISGKVVASVPIGEGVDATRFDPGTGLAFASCGDGTLTMAHQDSPDHYSVVQNIETMPGARTMELDPQSHVVYTVSAKFGAPPAAEASGRHRRPPMIPGTFELLAFGSQTPVPAPDAGPGVPQHAARLIAAFTAAHPEVANLELALDTAQGCHTVAASDPGDVGEACDDDELQPMKTGQPVVEAPTAGDPVYDITQALHDSTGHLIGAVGMDIRPDGRSREEVVARAKELLGELERQVASKADLLEQATP